MKPASIERPRNFAPERIEIWPIERLIPYAKNAKRHGDEQVDKIAASMGEYGWTVPVLATSQGEIIAGHGRVLAANRLGLSDVPVIVLDHLSEAQRQAYRIADNKLTELGEWDDALLSEELRSLLDRGYDISLTGYDIAEVEAIIASAEASGARDDEDDAPEALANPVSRKGDLWLCGNHRLLCGDSTVEADVSRLLNGVKPHLMVTDPPYGVEYDANWRNEADRANGKPYGARAIGLVKNDARADWREAWALFPGDVAYVWHAGRYASAVQASLEATGFIIRSQIIWAKTRLIISRGDYHWQHEPCWYAVRKTGKGHWAGDRSQTTLWTIDHKKSETGHSTQKPVECMRRPIVNNSSPGQTVYEPFCGSGTTMIAAETEGRHAYCMELSEAYCDVIVKRWQAFTGKSAVLDGDGRTFDEIAGHREAA